MIKKVLAAGLAAAATLMAVSPALADTFNSYLEAPVSNLDPLYLNSASARQVGSLIHRGLVAYSPTIRPPKNGAYHQIVPALAKSWEIGPDKKTYIFKLDPKARFQNGRKVTAADVKYSLERASNPNLEAPGYWAAERLNIKGLRRYQAAQRAGIKEPHLLGVEVMDHDIVVLQLEKPIPYALELLALPYFSIVPAEDVERWWKDYRTHPVGAGPYELDELHPGSDELTLKRFDGYYETGLPHTDQVHFDVLPQDKDKFLAFTRKQLDHTPLPTDFFRYVLADPIWNPLGEKQILQAEAQQRLDQTRVVKIPHWSTHYISMNNSSFPFNDLKVRQAFNYAVDKHFIIHDLLQTYGHPVTGIFPPGFPGATRKDPLYRYDPDKARKLLFEAGWRDKDGDGDLEPWQNPHLNLTLYYPETENAYLICRKVQSDLGNVGVSIQLAPLKSYWATAPGQHPAFFYTSWSPEILDPSQLFFPTFHSSQYATNLSHYDNPRVSELVGQAEDLTYEPRRYELYQEAERLIVDDAPWLFLYHPVSYQLVQPRVSQFVAHPDLPFPYELYEVQAAAQNND